MIAFNRTRDRIVAREVALADTAVRKHDDLLAVLSGDRVGTAVPVQILRGGKLETFTVTIGERA